jgi:methionyl-tRNA formyltransferase
MRLIFMGTPDFAVPSLRMLREAGHDVAAVVTAPDKKRGRGQKFSSTPVKAYAVGENIPVIEAENLKDPAFAEALRGYEAECFVVVAFRILPEAVFSIPTLGSFNLHASLLPKYRGAAPINWALINGERESGVTTFFMKKKVDTGSVIAQERVPIHEDMNAGELHDVLSVVGADVVLRTVAMIESGKVAALPQDDSAATPAPKIFRETCAIDWTKSARQVHNHIRGLSPYPAAWTLLDERQLQILRASIEDEDSTGVHGSVRLVDGKLRVQCGAGSVILHEIKPEGKKRMTVEDYLRGHSIPDRL